MTTPHHYDLVVVLVASWLAIESASYLDPQGRPVPAWRHEASRELVKDLRRLAISFPQHRLKVRLFDIKMEDADMAQNLQVGPKLGNIKKVLFLLFILLFILLY